MANQYYDVRVDISKSDVFDSGLRFTQGDSTVIYLRIAVMNGDSKFDASNTTPSVNFVKPDGTYVTGTPVSSGDVWVYQFLGNELQAAGRVLCDIKFTYSSGRISSSKFAFFVEKDTTISGAAASGNYVLPMEEALAEMNNYKQQGETMAEAAEASAFDSEAWAVGKRDGSDVPDTDPTYENNSKYYAAQAKISEENAAAIVGIGIATTTTAGIVKPDGTTITVAQDGTISSSGGSTSAAWGSITGTLSNQTDLQNALNAKQATLTEGDGIDITSNTVKVDTTFSDASSRSNIASGDLFGTILGKIKKYFSDLKDLAYIAKDGTSSTKYLRGDGTWQTLPASGDTVSIAGHGTASATVTHEQQITINSTAHDIDGTKYMEQTANSASFTFTNAAITANSVIDVYTSTWGDNPTSVTASSGSCSVTFGAAQSRTVRIYIR